MKSRLTLAQLRVIFILVAVLLIALTYFFVYQPNVEKVDDYKKRTAETNERITYLESLQPKVTDLEVFTSLYTDDIDGFIESFPVKLTQQKSIYVIYRLMVNSGIDIQSITPGDQVPFYYKGQMADAMATSEGEEEESMSEITVVPMEEMIGTEAIYTINFSGTTKQVYKALDWIRDNKERLSVGDVSLAFDKGSGKLSGSVGIHFYSMLGNGVPYKDPDTSGFNFGVNNVFGAMEKDDEE